MPVSAETYARVALEDPDGHWELVCGQLQQKPEMTTVHDFGLERLVQALVRQLDEESWLVSGNTSRLRVQSGNYRIPDVCVIPMTLVRRRLAEAPRALNVFDDAVPFVAEFWSPSTGDDDIREKLPEYRHRGDAELWYFHPYERTVTIWRRQADGSYLESHHREHAGSLPVASLPGVTIDLRRVFP